MRYQEIIEAAASNLIEGRYDFEDGSTYDSSDPVIAKYMEGGCYALAIAHHRLCRWPIVVMGDATEFEHAMVRHPSGALVDICGAHDPEEISHAWGGVTLTRMTESQIWEALNLNARKATLSGLREAKNVIETYLKPRFPDLYKR
jgi:hypothetical protein